MAESPGNVDADHFTLQIDKRSAGEARAQWLIVIKAVGEAIASFTEISTAGAERGEGSVSLGCGSVEGSRRRRGAEIKDGAKGHFVFSSLYDQNDFFPGRPF